MGYCFHCRLYVCLSAKTKTVMGGFSWNYGAGRLFMDPNAEKSWLNFGSDPERIAYFGYFIAYLVSLVVDWCEKLKWSREKQIVVCSSGKWRPIRPTHIAGNAVTTVRQFQIECRVAKTCALPHADYFARPVSRCRRQAYILPMLFSFFYMSPLSFDNGWTDRNAGCWVNTIDEKLPRLHIR